MALVVVFGAAGRQAMAQARQLKRAGHEVRAISRRTDPFLGEDFAAVEICPADIRDMDSVVGAMDGADSVFYTHPVNAAVGLVEAVTIVGQAAVKANMKRVVWNTSSWRPCSSGLRVRNGACPTSRDHLRGRAGRVQALQP